MIVVPPRDCLHDRPDKDKGVVWGSPAASAWARSKGGILTKEIAVVGFFWFRALTVGKRG
jgi:hypothetical protein